jgi:hypothetical protein
MPTVRKLVPEEVQALQDKGKGVRKLTEERYDRAVADFEAGDYGELTPDDGENRLTSRNRLKAAASRRGLSLTFIPTRGETMRFKVDTGGVKARQKQVRRERDYQDQPTPVVPALNRTTPMKKRGGRPRKQPA